VVAELSTDPKIAAPSGVPMFFTACRSADATPLRSAESC
jgi:hypothetical protein